MSAAPLPISDARLEEGLLYWRRKSGSRPMPSRADLDPIDIPKLLPYVALLDVLAPGRYRFRLIGTALAQEQGLNATGREVAEILKDEQFRAHVVGLLDECVRERRAVYSECVFLSPDNGRVERHTKRVFMPLSQDGKIVNMVFKLQIFLHIDPLAGERHFLESRAFREIAHRLL
jgi:hypothetical protein